LSNSTGNAPCCGGQGDKALYPDIHAAPVAPSVGLAGYTFQRRHQVFDFLMGENQKSAHPCSLVADGRAFRVMLVVRHQRRRLPDCFEFILEISPQCHDPRQPSLERFDRERVRS
jgi:hypothetical protein